MTTKEAIRILNNILSCIDQDLRTTINHKGDIDVQAITQRDLFINLRSLFDKNLNISTHLKNTFPEFKKQLEQLVSVTWENDFIKNPIPSSVQNPVFKIVDWSKSPDGEFMLKRIQTQLRPKEKFTMHWITDKYIAHCVYGKFPQLFGPSTGFPMFLFPTFYDIIECYIVPKMKQLLDDCQQ